MKKFCFAVLFFCLIFSTQVAASEISVEVNGQPVHFTDTLPMIIEGRTMVPLRGVFEQMGFSIEWDASTSTATFQRDDTIITIGTVRE